MAPALTSAVLKDVVKSHGLQSPLGLSASPFVFLSTSLSYLLLLIPTSALPLTTSSVLSASAISSKIAISEAIIEALTECGNMARINLPILSAHQIQGCDFEGLQELLNWLVDMVERNKHVREASLLRGSNAAIARNYERDAAAAAGGGRDGATGRTVKGRKRMFKLEEEPQMMEGYEEEFRVHRCLLSYGEKMRNYRGLLGGGFKSAGSSMVAFDGNFDDKIQKELEKAKRDEEEMQKKQDAIADKLMKNSTELSMSSKYNQSHCAKDEVGGLVVLDRDQISLAKSDYERISRESQNSNSEKSKAMQRKKRIESELKAVQDLLDKGERAAGDKARSLHLELGRAEEEEIRLIQKLQSELSAVASEVEQMSKSDPQMASELWSLLSSCDNSRDEDKAFKEKCKSELSALQSKLEELSSSCEETPAEKARAAEVRSLHEQVSARHAKARSLLSHHSLNLSNLTRKVDDFPTRDELSQYERRFSELYRQSNAKLEETRRYFATYNTLEATNKLLQKEVKLVDSITTSFQAASKRKGGEKDFLNQFSSIITDLSSTCDRQSELLKEKKQEYASFEKVHDDLVKTQRLYAKTLKDVKEQYSINLKLKNHAKMSNT